MKAEEVMKKLKAIADDTRGNDNERAVAQNQLKRLMEKHGITEEDLEFEVKRRHDFYFKESWEHSLICQTLYKVCGDIPIYRTAGKKNWIWTELTDAEYLEFELHYCTYKASFKKELDLFYLGFISKNDIYPPKEKARPDDGSPSQYSRGDRMRAAMMAQGIERAQIRRLIGDGEN